MRWTSNLTENSLKDMNTFRLSILRHNLTLSVTWQQQHGMESQVTPNPRACTTMT